MPVTIDQTRIDDLVARPTESLNVEIKRWINPDEPEGAAIIARAALAIRNRNGGFLIVGFDDKTLQPDAGNEPGDVRTSFHIDKIQGIVSRYTSELWIAKAFSGDRWPEISEQAPPAGATPSQWLHIIEVILPVLAKGHPLPKSIRTL